MKDVGSSAGSSNGLPKGFDLQLRREPPYWFEHNTYIKERWVGRQLLEVMVTDFYQRTSAYYQWAILKGYCKINGEIKPHDYILKQGDLLQNLVHKHEPAVTADPIRIIERDDEEGRLVVVKPGSIPVHAAGRYNKQTLLHLLKRELGLETIWTSNRIDRLTSGIMVCSTKKHTAHKLSEAFAMGKVRKAYVCRVRGAFPEGEIVCKEPLVQCDRQSGVSVVHAIGKECETIFNRMSYDADTDTSVVYCRPITGRTHQIRAHVQYLGHAIPNDPIYGHAIWEKYPPQMFKQMPLLPDRWKVEPESSLDVYGCEEIDAVSAALKTSRDEQDGWSRWKDEALFKRKLEEEGISLASVAGANGQSAADHRQHNIDLSDIRDAPDESEYCQECLVPLVPDLDSEEDLYIYLHAIKYETDDWTFEDELPWWAQEDWKKRPRLQDQQAAVVYGTTLKDAPKANGHQEIGPTGHEKSTTKSIVTLPAGRQKGTTESMSTLPAVVPLIRSLSSTSIRINASIEPCQSAVVMEVFGGMEDFAALELRTKIQFALPSETLHSIHARLHTSHILISPGLAAQSALHLYKTGQLHSINKVYLCFGEAEIPVDIRKTLETERVEMVLLKEGVNQSKRARAKAKKGGQSLPDPAQGGIDLNTRTETEEQLLKTLKDGWDQVSGARNEAFREWKRLTEVHMDPTTDHKMSYRGTVDRSGYHLPTMKTTDIEHAVGVLAWNWLNGEDEEDGTWSVNLTKPDLEVVVKLLPGWHNGTDAVPYWRTRMINFPGSFVYLLRVPPKTEPSHRPPLPIRLTEGGTALARYRSFTIVSALPVIDNVREPLLIWEPCVGSGSIAIELDALLSRSNRKYHIYASDLFQTEIDKAKEVCELCKTSKQVTLGCVDATNLDASVAFLGGQDILDCIVTDLPWGRRVANHLSISSLYPALLKVWVQILKPGGTVVVMTAEHKNFLRAIKIHEADVRKKNTGWILSVEEVQISGISDQAPKDMLEEATRMSKFRTVACGYDVSVIFLRKRSLME